VAVADNLHHSLQLGRHTFLIAGILKIKGLKQFRNEIPFPAQLFIFLSQCGGVRQFAAGFPF